MAVVARKRKTSSPGHRAKHRYAPHARRRTHARARGAGGGKPSGGAALGDEAEAIGDLPRAPCAGEGEALRGLELGAQLRQLLVGAGVGLEEGGLGIRELVEV
eukprot:CAMPEP_0176273774 /NCGR_PEP_ID=MMETSP0121_2-20121125/46390_1 /TAXON_ID=160619 /ORGANISM="Kryptoperidinium foliaceum, Strain CCMP 1326" /LENGTH=102 /DNA_ID=CAMNT_0017613963 /DNA_START=42 /DNA_END=346 /DNA_ORIENTATION=+